jgi:hypothetical protein
MPRHRHRALAMHALPLRTMRIASARRKQLAAWMHVRASASSVWAFECARVSQYTCAQRSSVGVALWQGRARLRARVAHVIVSKHWSMGEYPSSACSASAADPIHFSATGPIRRPMPKGRSPDQWQAIERRPPHAAACHSAESHRRRRCTPMLRFRVRWTAAHAPRRQGPPTSAWDSPTSARDSVTSAPEVGRSTSAVCGTFSGSSSLCEPCTRQRTSCLPTVRHVDSRDEPP